MYLQHKKVFSTFISYLLPWQQNIIIPYENLNIEKCSLFIKFNSLITYYYYSYENTCCNRNPFAQKKKIDLNIMILLCLDNKMQYYKIY